MMLAQWSDNTTLYERGPGEVGLPSESGGNADMAVLTLSANSDLHPVSPQRGVR
jgi:hypothetical protein